MPVSQRSMGVVICCMDSTMPYGIDIIIVNDSPGGTYLKC